MVTVTFELDNKVIYEGKVQAELSVDRCDEETLLNAAHGKKVS